MFKGLRISLNLTSFEQAHPLPWQLERVGPQGMSEESRPCPSLAEALGRAGSAPSLGSTVELTLVV